VQQLQSRVYSGTYAGSNKFFRSRLLTSTAEEISAVVDKMEKEANAIRSQCLKMSWHLRGGGSYEDVMNMSFQERTLISELIKENIETTKTSKLPFF
jgi:hypothetical protein